MNSLLKAIKLGGRLILVGDKDQLPSVGAGNVLADIIKCELFSVNYLTHIYRQGADSLIVTNAHNINSGKMPTINNSSKDFFFINCEDTTFMLGEVVGLVKERLPKFTDTKSSDIQVLAALKNGACGVNNLNTQLQTALNPSSRTKTEIVIGFCNFRLGDKVMQTSNNYDLGWEQINTNGTISHGTGVFNGEIGTISFVDRSEGLTQITFDDGRVVSYTMTDLTDVVLAYSITIHKSQGSEFDVVVIPLLAGAPTIINRNLLYTAVTRAKKVVVLVGSKKVLSMMVYNNFVSIRTTLLCHFLITEQQKYQSLL